MRGRAGHLPVALDAMGGDDAPAAMVAGAVLAAKAGVPVVLVGDRAAIEPLVPARSGIEIVHAPDAVRMDESPAAVRRKEGASVRVALRLIEEGKASSMVSCGNSGAVLVASVLDAGILDGVERPAIATVLPRVDGGRLVMLDAGANVDTPPEHLASFAVLGVAYARTLGVQTPRVALLSNGEEEGKGNEAVRAARSLIQALPITFVGNVEPSGALSGRCDVLVCDGFVGNVMIKAVEAAGDTIVALLKQEIRRHPTALLGAWLLSRALRRFQHRVSWETVGGGVLLGTRRVVVIGHGRSNARAVQAALRLAHQAAEQGLVERVERRLAAANPTG